MGKKLGPVARIMKAARRYVARGWVKGTLHCAHDEDGRRIEGGCYCISGALGAAERDLAHNASEGHTYGSAAIQEFVYQHGLSRYAKAKMGFVPTNHVAANSPIVGWNDDTGRTQTQVVAALDRAFAAAKELGV